MVNLLQKNGWEIGDLEDREADAEEFDSPAEGMQTPLPMLYQSGYLTIKSRDPFTGAYTLGIPNAEVARGLSRALVRLNIRDGAQAQQVSPGGTCAD